MTATYEAQIKKVQTLLNKGVSKTKIAEEIGVSTRTIGRWLDRAAEEAAKAVTKKAPAKKSTTAAKKPVAKTAKTKTTYKCIANKNSVSITKLVDGKVEGTQTIDKKNESFEDIYKKAKTLNEKVLEQAYLQMQPAKRIEQFTSGRLNVDVKKNVITFNPAGNEAPYVVHNSLASRIIKTIGEKGVEGAESLLNFLDKLMDNPSYRSVQELYGFLEHNDIEIAQDGDFIAWKKVRSDYLDIHSGTMDNSPGKVLRVNRNQVDEDSNRTCSHGLHVCAKSYLSQFGSGSSNDRVIRVKVNPADVVAIPKDYNNAKMRCAGYTVLDDVTKTIR